MPSGHVLGQPSTTSSHEWVAWIPLHVNVIKNEDGVYGFGFKFNNPDQQIIAKWDPQHTWCAKCGRPIEEVFNDICTEQAN